MKSVCVVAVYRVCIYSLFADAAVVLARYALSQSVYINSYGDKESANFRPLFIICYVHNVCDDRYSI